jgi:hypothetical protein
MVHPRKRGLLRDIPSNSFSDRVDGGTHFSTQLIESLTVQASQRRSQLRDTLNTHLSRKQGGLQSCLYSIAYPYAVFEML